MDTEVAGAGHANQAAGTLGRLRGQGTKNRQQRAFGTTMGPNLKGASPPFSPSGKAAFTRSLDLGNEMDEPIQAAHIGIMLRYRFDRANAEKLLPRPLEPVAESNEMYLFVNITQSGINMFKGDPADGRHYLRALNPYHSSWHEANFMIPCAYRGVKGKYVSLIYKDNDHGVILGLYDGFSTKLAEFHRNFPLQGQPLNEELKPGGTVSMTMSRFDERIMTTSFRATREVPKEEMLGEPGLAEYLTTWIPNYAVRFFPDYTNPGGPPLAHDLVYWGFGGRDFMRAWAGEAELTFTDSDIEELHLVEPIEMLPTYFVHLQYTGGFGMQSDILHDYVVEPLTD